MSGQNEFLEKNMVPLFSKYAIAAFIGLLAQGIMVFCEGVIIGNGLGTTGLAVVGILMPLEYLNLALNGFFGIGISTICAMYMGEGKVEKAKKAFSGGTWLSFLVTAAVAILIIIFATPIARFLGAPEEIMDVTPMAIRIFMAFIPFETVGQVANYMVRVDNRPKLGSIIVTGAAVVALAWLYTSTYVFGFGIAGMSVYYGFTIGLWFVLMFYFMGSKKTTFKFRLGDIKYIDKETTKDVAKVGYPYFFVQVATCVFAVVINNMLGTEIGIAAWTVLSGYIIYILMMVQQGCTQGIQPIASYNLGAGRKDRVKQILKVGSIAEIIVVYIAAAICIVFRKAICTVLCGSDQELIAMAMQYMVIVCATISLGLLADLVSGYFQAVERQIASAVLALSRYIIFGIPAMLICKAIMGEMGIWYGISIGSVCACILTIVLLIFEFKRLSKDE